MELTPTEEQEELRASLRRFLSEKSPSTEVRRLMETEEGYDPAVWAQMAGQLGLQGMALPEKFGGAGFGAGELGVVFEELGRSLACTPYFSTVALAANALLAAGDDAAQGEHLPGIADGSTVATLALSEDDGRFDTEAVTARAARDGDRYLLDGVKAFVPDGHVAGLLLVTARAEHGVSLFAVDGDATGLTRTPMSTLDRTRKLARLVLAGVPGRLVGEEGAAAAFLPAALDRALAALAWEQVGGAQRCLDMAVDYAKIRVQFGRPIGSFQAIKHKCADVAVAVESARSAALLASWTAANDPEQLAAAASSAKAYCSEAYVLAAAENIQIHGGIGFTWEHDAHLYFRRAKSSELLFGSPDQHRERVARLAGL